MRRGSPQTVAALRNCGPAALDADTVLHGDGDEPERGGAAVEGALAGGGHGEEGIGEQADRGPAMPGGPGGDLAAIQSADRSSTG